MNKKTTLKISFNHKTIEVPFGTKVHQIFNDHSDLENEKVLAAIVDNRCVDLDFPLCSDTTVEPVTYAMREGVLVYRKTASLILFEAARRLWPDVDVFVDQALSNGYVYEFVRNKKSGLTQKEFDELEAEMWRLVGEDIRLRRQTVTSGEAKKLFANKKDRLRLLNSSWQPTVELIYCGDFYDIHHYPVAPRTGMINIFELDREEPQGVLLRFPTRKNPSKIPPLRDSPKLKQAYTETRRWLRLLQVNNVGKLNELTLSGKVGDLLRIAEGLHEKKIAQIADRICDAHHPVRLVAIAGPSASGKTTFSKRLSMQLRVNGFQPVALSTDNFYVDRVDTPKDEDGNYDFEALEAIDLELFNDVLLKLLAGQEVETPVFDFNSGTRRPKDKWRTMRLEKDQILVIEGIHGLNPRLTQAIEDDRKFRIYISALTQLRLDNQNRIFTSDTRLLRRIVRDRMFRGYSAADTIKVWPSVRRGEQHWIFPFQEGADIMFNSALVYEHALLKLYAERFLLEVPEDDPAHVTAYRLLRFISHFVPIFDEDIPQTSLLREFIGGSYFQY